jgi:hypothetical protein
MTFIGLPPASQRCLELAVFVLVVLQADVLVNTLPPKTKDLASGGPLSKAFLVAGGDSLNEVLHISDFNCDARRQQFVIM